MLGGQTLVQESQTFLKKIDFLSQFDDEKLESFKIVLPGDEITRESGFIQ